MPSAETEARTGAAEGAAPGAPAAAGPVRVLFVINQLGPGGTERSLADLIAGLEAEGVETSVACLRTTAAAFQVDARVTCPVEVLPGAGVLAKARHLRKTLRRSPPDLVHTMLFEADLVGRLAAAGTGVPVLSSLVNTSYEPVRFRDPNISRLRLRAVQIVDAVTGRLLTTHFHALTSAVKDSAVRRLRLPPERITVVPRGRDTRRLGAPSPERRERARRALGLEPEDEVVVNVGRQDYQKGHRYLQEAAALLAPERPRLRVVVAGKEGRMTPELGRLLADRRLEGTVRFLGNRSDVPEVLAAGDVFAFPSLYEGIGGAVIEAMALGLPVVCSDLPPLREVVDDGESALLVPPEDPPALAAALARILDDPELARRFGRRGREAFLERFSLERGTEEMARLYRALVHSSREATP
ncbi:MAG TPA: glycosyltransferase family 4 protein [Thermoanaerobaculia bacterium]|nr:glycosyltransferase family 4 protein [Thermoanaerobaculia bacterium]